MSLLRSSMLAAVALLVGCSTVPAQDPHAKTGTGPVQALPDNELSPPLLYDLLTAEVALQRGDLALAGSNYLRAAWDTRDPRLAKRAMRVAVFARDLPRAREAAELWVNVAPADLEARQSLAALLIQSGKAEEATEHLEKVLADSPDSGQAFQAVTGLLSRDADKAQALTLLERLIEKRRDDPNALFAHAHLAFVLGRHDAAMASLDEVLKKRPAWSRALVLQANVLRAVGRLPESRAAHRAAVDASPEDASLRLSYAKALVDDREYIEARGQFETLAKQLPDSPEIVYALGLLAMQLGDLDQAENAFRQMLAGEHRDEAAFAMGQIAESREQYDDAQRWYAAVSEQGNFLEARVRIAVVIARHQGVDAARQYLGQLRDQLPDERARLYLAEGELLRDHERLEEAVQVFDAGLLLTPDSADLLYARAMVAERMDRLDLLEQDLRRILAADPDNAQALNALGYTLADRTDRYQEAHDLVRRALEQHPDDPAINDSMGWVLFRLGRYEEAETHLKRAAVLMQDPEVSAHLGELYWVTGRKDDARRVWDEGLQLSPDNRILKRVIERLTQ